MPENTSFTGAGHPWYIEKMKKQPTAEELAAWYESLPVGDYQEFRRKKEEARMHDLERIARGEATPEQIQRENEIFTPEQMKTFRILNLEEVLENMK